MLLEFELLVHLFDECYSRRLLSKMSVPPADGSEDVNDFLLRIKELGDRRDQEDEERNRKLEEEILQGRKERQARRAGRSIGFVMARWCCDSSSYLKSHG